jgi:hypothetical protein
MSTYIYSYDDETHDRFYEVEIEFSTEEPYHGATERGFYRIAGEIIIEKVRVLYVEYYNPDGDTICKIKRENMNPICVKLLDSEEEERIINWVCDGDPICDDLWENRG